MASAVRRIFAVCAANRALLRPRLPITQTACGLKHNEQNRLKLKSLHERRIEQGPEPERHRSVWLNWNYDAELYSFGKRLNEEFKEDTLRMAFTEKSYVDLEEKRRAELGMAGDDIPLNMKHNVQLAELGGEVADRYIKGYLRHSLPRLPEEGICSISWFLLSEQKLAHIATNIGIKDLIHCEEFPVTSPTLSHTFKAVVGALSKDQGEERAYTFIQDFILTQLVGKDVFEMWELTNPMGLLQGILVAQAQGEAEPRLLWATGSETIMAAYMVGIYSDKQLIGQAPGETVTIAEEMAARDALRRIFGASIDSMPFKFGKEGHKLSIDTQTVNTSMLEYTEQPQMRS